MDNIRHQLEILFGATGLDEDEEIDIFGAQDVVRSYMRMFLSSPGDVTTVETDEEDRSESEETGN